MALFKILCVFLVQVPARDVSRRPPERPSARLRGREDRPDQQHDQLRPLLPPPRRQPPQALQLFPEVSSLKRFLRSSFYERHEKSPSEENPYKKCPKFVKSGPYSPLQALGHR